MTYHDLEIYFALAVLAYTLSIMLGLALRDLWRATVGLLEAWVER